MIKEIEVGGVKHSITLADDMVGSGLKRHADGAIGVAVSHGLKVLIGPNSTMSVDVNSLCGSGLTSDGYKLAIDINQLAGSGLVAYGGQLVVSGGGGSVDAGSLAGNGLRLIEGNRLGLALSGSNLLKFGPDDTLDINISQLSGLGLEADNGKLSISSQDVANMIVGSGLFAYKGRLALALSGNRYLKFADDWTLDVDTFYLASGLCGSGLYVEDGRLSLSPEKLGSGLEKIPENGLKVKITQRSSGLRLILNDNGELDVTQD